MTAPTRRTRSSSLRRALGTVAAVAALGAAPLALSHLVKEEPMQSFRQSYFTLVAMNFGPIASMVKGEMPWDADKVLMLAEDVEALSKIDVLRAFPVGSDKGQTRAKPEIWKDMEHFKEEYVEFQEAAAELLMAAQTGDKGAVAAAVRATGGSCKGCHDDFKSKDYLY